MSGINPVTHPIPSPVPPAGEGERRASSAVGSGEQRTASHQPHRLSSPFRVARASRPWRRNAPPRRFDSPGVNPATTACSGHSAGETIDGLGDMSSGDAGLLGPPAPRPFPAGEAVVKPLNKRLRRHRSPWGWGGLRALCAGSAVGSGDLGEGQAAGFGVHPLSFYPARC